MCLSGTRCSSEAKALVRQGCTHVHTHANLRVSRRKRFLASCKKPEKTCPLISRLDTEAVSDPLRIVAATKSLRTRF